MQKRAHTYRIVAVLTGFLVMAGISVPSGQHTKQFMAGHCEMPKKAAPVHHDDCPMSENMAPHGNTDSADHYHGTTGNSGCVLDITCGCSIGDNPATNRAVQSYSKSFGGLYPVIIDFAGETKIQTVPAGHSIETEALAASPPLFLKHGSFLN